MHKILFPVLAVLLLMGCSATESVVEREPVSVSEQEIETAALSDDPEIAARLDQYRDRYNREMGIRIAELTAPAVFDKPEGALGNMAADAIRYRAMLEARKYVHIGVMGGDSFRLNFNEGELTLGEIYEFMPYENHLVLIQMKGSTVIKLSNQIAERNGEPISGLRLRFDNGEARSILVNSEVVNPDKLYWLATSNYYADRGGSLPALTEYDERIDYEDLSIRQLYVDYFRNLRVIEPATDGRIQ